MFSVFVCCLYGTVQYRRKIIIFIQEIPKMHAGGNHFIGVAKKPYVIYIYVELPSTASEEEAI